MTLFFIKAVISLKELILSLLFLLTGHNSITSHNINATIIWCKIHTGWISVSTRSNFLWHNISKYVWEMKTLTQKVARFFQQALISQSVFNVVFQVIEMFVCSIINCLSTGNITLADKLLFHFFPNYITCKKMIVEMEIFCQYQSNQDIEKQDNLGIQSLAKMNIFSSCA